jgi:hypothetical protein
MSQKPVQSARQAHGDPNAFAVQHGEQPKNAAAPPAPRPSRPLLVDHLLILLGVALSTYLCRIDPLLVEAREVVANPRLRTAVSYLPDVMRLPEGVLLLGPLFLVGQFVTGRRQGLTSIEWLWLLSWLGVVGLSGLTAWKAVVVFPDAVLPYLALVPRLWYVFLVPSMAALAVVVRVLSLFSRRPAPWTHSFGLALLVWPVPPLVAIVAVARFQG